MSIKDLLKPNKSKILVFISIIVGFLLLGVFILLFTVSVYTTPSKLQAILSFPFALIILLLGQKPMFFLFLILIILTLTYFFGCYIITSKKWAKGIILYIFCYLLIVMVTIFMVKTYNETYAHSCTTDLDCNFYCGIGSVNNKYIDLYEMFRDERCDGSKHAVCESNLCSDFYAKDALSSEDCERGKDYYVPTTPRRFPAWSFKTECYLTLAKKFQDPDLCQGILGEKVKCFSGNWSGLCDNPTYFNLKSNCYLRLAKDLINPALCEKVDSIGGRIECYGYMAGKLNDLKLCKNMKDINEIESCYFYTAQQFSDLTLCNEITDNNKKLNCVKNLVKKSGNVNLCGKAEDAEIKEECYRYMIKELRYAVLTYNLSVCTKIGDHNERIWCTQYLAEKLKDTSMCIQVEDEEIKGWCYYFIAIKLQDEKLCIKIEKTRIKDLCYEQLSYYLGDRNLCNKVENELERNKCNSAHEEQ